MLEAAIRLRAPSEVFFPAAVKDKGYHALPIGSRDRRRSMVTL
jgi:hypothetical protein